MNEQTKDHPFYQLHDEMAKMVEDGIASNKLQNRQQSSGTAQQRDDVAAFIASVQPTIETVRRRLQDLNAAHTSKRAALLNRCTDELAAMDKQHSAARTALQDILDKLVEFRD